MATSGLDQFFDKLRNSEEFLTFFKSEIIKLNGEIKSEEPMDVTDSPWLNSFNVSIESSDLYTPCYQSLSSPIFEQMDFADLDLTTEDWPEVNIIEDNIQCLETFKNEEIFTESDSFITLMDTLEEESKEDIAKFTFTDIQPLKDKYRSALIQFTLFSANLLVCFTCYENLVAKDEKILNCSNCNYDLPSSKSIEEIKAGLKQAVIEHTALCPELFLHFDFSDEALYVACDGASCTYHKYVDI